MRYEPLLLESASLDRFKSAEYERFIHASVIEPSIRLLLDRHRRRRQAGLAEYPFIDTKFNPNSGADLGEEHYRLVHSWFLGRGSEALVEHLAILDSLELSESEKSEARDVFSRWLANMIAGIRRMMAVNRGRCPFRLNLAMEAVDEKGSAAPADPNIRSPGDLFCAKGLMAEGDGDNVVAGFDLLARVAGAVRAGQWASDQIDDPPGAVGQGPRMLIIGAASLLWRRMAARSSRTAGRAATHSPMASVALGLAEECMGFVLDRHWDAGGGRFSEYLRLPPAGPGGDEIDPGHATEFVGLSLQAVECMQADRATLAPVRERLIERAISELPRILLHACERGWNEAHQGLHKLVDNRTGQPINDDMPWWNLPETMRAAVRCAEVVTDEAIRTACLDWARRAHNAYFANYLNRDKMLFPYQTRSGSTGKVVDKVPAVPEGDPLYHTNLSLLDMLAVLRRMG